MNCKNAQEKQQKNLITSERIVLIKFKSNPIENTFKKLQINIRYYLYSKQKKSQIYIIDLKLFLKLLNLNYIKSKLHS